MALQLPYTPVLHRLTLSLHYRRTIELVSTNTSNGLVTKYSGVQLNQLWETLNLNRVYKAMQTGIVITSRRRKQLGANKMLKTILYTVLFVASPFIILLGGAALQDMSAYDANGQLKTVQTAR